MRIARAKIKSLPLTRTAGDARARLSRDLTREKHDLSRVTSSPHHRRSRPQSCVPVAITTRRGRSVGEFLRLVTCLRLTSERTRREQEPMSVERCGRPCRCGERPPARAGEPRCVPLKSPLRARTAMMVPVVHSRILLLRPDRAVTGRGAPTASTEWAQRNVRALIRRDRGERSQPKTAGLVVRATGGQSVETGGAHGAEARTIRAAVCSHANAGAR